MGGVVARPYRTQVAIYAVVICPSNHINAALLTTKQIHMATWFSWTVIFSFGNTLRVFLC